MLDAIRRWFSPPRRPADWPDELRAFVDAAAALGRDRPIDEVRFVVIDTETTGLDTRTDRLLSIAGVAVERGAIVPADSFEATVRQHDVGGAAAAAVHGLVRRDVEGGVDEAVAVASFFEWARGAVLVGHHLEFDLAVIEASVARRLGLHTPLGLPVARLDTEHLARRVEGAALAAPGGHGGARGEERHSLDALLSRYHLENVERHTAAGDALATAELLQALLAKARRRGIASLRSLLKTPTR